MKLSVFLFTLIAFSTTAFAAVKLRVPVLLKDYANNKSYCPSELKAELKNANLVLPDFVYIEKPEDQEILGTYASAIEEANIPTKDGAGSYEGVQYGDLNDYTGKDLKYSLCYISDTKSKKDGAREAFDFWINLGGDGLLSDQYTIAAFRFFDQKVVHMYEYGDENYDGGEWDSNSDDEFEYDWSEFESLKLKTGEVQIMSTTSDSGDDPSSSVLSPCE